MNDKTPKPEFIKMFVNAAVCDYLAPTQVRLHS